MEGERNAVIGRFGTRRAGNLVELPQDKSTSLFGTHNLSIWPLDRQEWVPLSELWTGTT